jgi:thioredoxin reductase (NADPH)
MTDPVDPPPPPNPVLDVATVEGLAVFGRPREFAAGEILYEAGDERWDLLVVTAGRIDVVRVHDEQSELVVSYGPGQFSGELGLLTGQRALLTARGAEAGRAIAVAPDDLHRLMAARPAVADILFATLLGRRRALPNSPGAMAVQIVGSRFSAEALALRTYAARNRLVHTWVDLEEADDVGVLLASMGLRSGDTPVVVTPTRILRRATPGQFAELMGMTYRPVPGRTFDLVVVGAGPAGLAASVSAASEGLDVVTLDATAPGGQAGTSSRIENYAGFPNGISGGDLAARTAAQAVRLGARLLSPCQVASLHRADGFHVVQLVDGSEIPTRSVLVATGARYRRLDVTGLGRFEGSGVYYAATDLEVRSCAGSDVAVVGGGNSAGQAALYLRRQGSTVAIVIRGSDLATSMSSYLVERIESDPEIRVVRDTQVRELHGADLLESIVVEHTPSGARETWSCEGLFCFIGAQPTTAWLTEVVVLDDRGFVPTDRGLGPGSFPLGRAPFPYETSEPGVFAVGDVRAGSMKRVATAVGEGSSAIRSVYEYVHPT